MRPIDLARTHGLSTQAVRNYEQAAVLPAAERSPHGYRTYTPRHAAALATFLALIPAHGHATATAIMRAVNAGETEQALRLIDDSHAQLAEDRRTVDAVERALRESAPPAEPQPGVTFIGPLAHRLGLRPATLRKWQRAGLITPRRDPGTGYRVYTSADVRDVLLAHQLRRGGYGLAQLAEVLHRVRTAGGPEPLQATMRQWRDRLTARGVAMLTGAAALAAYLRTP